MAHTSYKEEFHRWKAEYEANGTIFYNRLSDVIDTENDLEVGDMVMFTNDYGITFGPHEVLAFDKPQREDWGRCVYFDHASYWFAARPDQLTLVRKGGAA